MSISPDEHGIYLQATDLTTSGAGILRDRAKFHPSIAGNPTQSIHPSYPLIRTHLQSHFSSEKPPLHPQIIPSNPIPIPILIPSSSLSPRPNKPPHLLAPLLLIPPPPPPPPPARRVGEGAQPGTEAGEDGVAVAVVGG